MDDILISAENLSQLFKNTEEVLQVLFENGLQIVPLKCQFGATEVSFLGFMISGDGKSLGPQLIKKHPGKGRTNYNILHRSKECRSTQTKRMGPINSW